MAYVDEALDLYRPINKRKSSFSNTEDKGWSKRRFWRRFEQKVGIDSLAPNFYIRTKLIWGERRERDAELRLSMPEMQ